MQNKIKMTLADDHPILLKELAEVLTERGYDLLATASDGAVAFEHIIKFDPDVAILDLDMPAMTGLQVVARCQIDAPNTRIILLSYSKEPALILKAKQYDILGYLIKKDAIKEIDRCIRSVLRDEFFASKQVKDLDLSRASNVMAALNQLSPTERQVIRKLATGHSTKVIAKKMQVSPSTVDKHRSRIIHKLGILGKPNYLLHWAIEHKDNILMLD